MAVMATEEPQTLPLDQKIASIAPEEDRMAVNEPAPQAVNGHSKSDGAKSEFEEVPTLNGNAESPKAHAKSTKDVQNKQAFAANSGLPEQTLSTPGPEQPSDDREMSDVNGTVEDVPTVAVKSEIAPSAAGSAAKDDAADLEPLVEFSVDESMDLDVPTERPDITSSGEHAESTQENSAMSDSALVSSPQNLSQSADMSKLDIKGSQDETPTSQPDAVMPDRPASLAKISRERDEDPSDEPAAKRTKTESRAESAEDTIGVATGSKAAASATERPADGGVPDDKPITPHQNKELRLKLGNIKKTKAGANFRASVEKLWPGLWLDYKDKIDKPVDIALFEAKLREEKYATYGDFKADVRLLHENAQKFNGLVHDVTRAAADVMNKLFNEDLPKISKMEEPQKSQKGKAHPLRHAEPRHTIQDPRTSQSQPRPAAPSPKSKPDAAAAAPTPPASTSAPSTAPAFALPPNGVPQIRRDSTRDDGDRPKRPIHPPKNRDLDYSSKASRKKKLEPEMKFFQEVLTELGKPKHFLLNQWFLAPVDPVAMNIPTYFSIVKKPMDLQTMNEKLGNGEYRNAKDLEKDMRQIVLNSELFNGAESDFSKWARELEQMFKDEMSKKDAWMARWHPQVVAPAASPEPSVHESDEESEFEAEEDDNEQIRGLVSRVAEEQDKLSTLLGAKKPDLVMIEMQQSIVNMLQRKLVEERSKFNETRKPKAKKKGTKSKSKPTGGPASGNGSKKPSGGPSFSKKSSAVHKKSVPKIRHIGSLEKAVIAEGINELDGPTLNKAVEIIKRDTKQQEDDDGQLELDIELLSQGALNKLYDLIMKAYPAIYATVAARPEFNRQEEPEEAPRAKASGGSASKPKKNKPMNKHEQERNIEKLRELKAQFQRHGSGSQEPQPNEGEENQLGDSSEEESDSEEE